MILLLAISIGVLFGTGAYMLMRRSLVKLVMGLALFGHAANLLIYATARPMRGMAPLVKRGESEPPSPFSDPLPAALVLTAIVIGFGIVSYTIVLIKRAYQDVGSDDLALYTETDR
ncbi:MAG: NADH-quinone oxidoreductase subunit K [Planctomycetota bacterium]